MLFRNLLVTALAILIAGSLIAFARSLEGTPRTPFPHGTHIENELECTDCHEGAEDEAHAGIPDATTCAECHEEPEEEGDAIAAFFAERADGEGGLKLADSLTFADLKFSHQAHVAQGADCSDCHGDVPKGRFLRPGNPDFKHTCMDCHELTKAPKTCEACHDTYSDKKKPASHLGADFATTHGRGVKAYFNELAEGTCFYCHKTDHCDACHSGTKPSWHDRPNFLHRHGDKVRFNHLSMDEAGCGACHDKSGCRACHATSEPRSHTVSFKNRTHGVTARKERQVCKVCHDQSFCIHCHTSVEPISHRSQFNRNAQTHCFSCHLPLTANTCFTCHKTLVGHDTLPKPVDGTHNGATANSCRLCHSPVPHADNGMNCLLCH